MTNVHDVAAHIVAHFDSPISTMKLQKLSFFAQGWSLALLKRPLFDEEFRAWRNGPVCYELFDKHRGLYTVAEWPDGNSKSLNEFQLVVVDAMLNNFEALNGMQLSQITHRSGTPWAETRAASNTSMGESSTEVIDKSRMQEFFTSTLITSVP